MDLGTGLMARVLAVDPGGARIGIAVSDSTGVIARPLTVLQHESRQADARVIAQLALRHEVSLIVVGLALDQHGKPGPQARRALRLVEALREAAEIPVQTWDESGSTQMAVELGGQEASLDARAAAVILQDYLNAATP